MRENTALADRHRSYPHVQGAVGMDDIATDQLSAAARELEAHLLFEHARHLSDVRDLLAELYQRDGVAVDDAMLDAQAEEVAAQERAERFLQELSERIQPGLSCWRWPATSMTTPWGCGGRPPVAWWRRVRRGWRICDGGWRRSSAASCAATPTWSDPKANLAAYYAATGWRGGCGTATGSRSCAASSPTAARNGSGWSGGLPSWTPKFQVIQRVEQARTAWITQARQVLARGLAAVQILTEREQRSECGDPPWPAKPDQMRQGMVS